MDCRKHGRRAGRRWLAILSSLILFPGSLASLTGCLPSATVPVTPPGALPPAAVAEKKVVPEKDQPKRELQPTTCVAFGNLELEAAAEGNRTPAQRQELFEMARKYFRQALKGEPRCREAYHGLGKAYEGVGDYDRAVGNYQNAVKAYPKDASFWFELGMCQARHRDWKPALENLKIATDLDPENRAYANTRGYCLARAGRYEESVAYFKKFAGEARAHYNVARMLHHLKQDEACELHLNLALKAEPGFKEAQEMLAALRTPGTAASRSTATVGFESFDERAAAQAGTSAARHPQKEAKLAN